MNQNENHKNKKKNIDSLCQELYLVVEKMIKREIERYSQQSNKKGKVIAEREREPVSQEFIPNWRSWDHRVKRDNET